MDYYSSLYASENSDEQCRNELLCNLPALASEQKNSLEIGLTYEEVTAAVMGLSVGRAPGNNGLPAEFFKAFWPVLGNDCLEVLQKSITEKNLPKSFQRAILTLLPRKGDLTLLKNWRPLAVLCSDYKIFSKSLVNRANDILHKIIYKDQSSCIKDRSITDNLHLVRDLYDYAYNNKIEMGFFYH